MKEQAGGFLVTVFKDVYTEEQLRKLDLNERQIKAMIFLKENKKITNKDYQTLADTSERTALRDLEDLASKQLISRLGKKKGIFYQLKNGG